MDLLLAGSAFLFFLFTFIGIFSFDTLIRWKDAHFKILDRSADHPIRFIFFATLLGFILFSLRVHTFRLAPVWHKFVLCLVCLYTFVLFNPIQAVSTAKANEPVYCPDGYAYSVGGGNYIRCEDFDLFHAEQHQGRVRTDLYIK